MSECTSPELFENCSHSPGCDSTVRYWISYPTISDPPLSGVTHEAFISPEPTEVIVKLLGGSGVARGVTSFEGRE